MKCANILNEDIVIKSINNERTVLKMKNYNGAQKAKRIIILLLLSIIFMPVLLVSCSKNDSGNSGREQDGENSVLASDISGNEPENTGDARAARLSVDDGLPEKDYGGDKFHVLYIDWSSYQLYQFADEEIGEVMNDAIYYREKNVDERFNINIEKTKINYGEVIKYVSKSVKAGSHEYDLVLTHCNNELAGLMAGNYVLDWNTFPTIDFTKPWWNQDAINTLSIKNKLFFATSDFIIPEPNAVFFNKGMIQNYGLDDPYALVREGKWTIDKMYDMAKAVGKDIDGDGEWTDKDQYGLVTQFGWYFLSIGPSCNIKSVIKDDTGRPVINTDVGKMQSILEKYHRLVNDKTITFTFPYGAMGDQYISALPLSTGRVLFHFDPLPQAVRYRDTEVDYGILPFPKYDEVQEKYMNLSWNGFMAVPATVPDLEKQGIIVEALSAESYKYCVPAFYDVLMNVKLTRDEDSVEMLDIIYAGCVYDLDITYETNIGGIIDLLTKKSTDYVSNYEKKVGAAQKKLDKVYDSVED